MRDFTRGVNSTLVWYGIHWRRFSPNSMGTIATSQKEKTASYDQSELCLQLLSADSSSLYGRMKERMGEMRWKRWEAFLFQVKCSLSESWNPVTDTSGTFVFPFLSICLDGDELRTEMNCITLHNTESSVSWSEVVYFDEGGESFFDWPARI